MYGYTYDFGGGTAASAVLMLIALVAAIVLTVMGYNRYARQPGQGRINLGDRSTWGPFLRFDTLLIERILKVLYLFSALFAAFSAIAVVLSALFANFAAGLVTLVVMAIFVVIMEIVIRLAFEALMLNVVIARNTSDIKRAMGVGDPMDADGISSPAPSASEYAAPGYAPSAQPQPYQGQAAYAPADGFAGTSTPGAEAASSCPNCGAQLAPGASFCGTCGTKLG